MNCCDSYGNCRQGRECPVRYASAVEVYTAKMGLFERFVRWLARVWG